MEISRQWYCVRCVSNMKRVAGSIFTACAIKRYGLKLLRRFESSKGQLVEFSSDGNGVKV